MLDENPPTKEVVEIDHEQAGRMFQAERERKGLSRLAVARRLGISETYLRHHEIGACKWSLDFWQRAKAALEAGVGK